jgi:outer membrane protein OmpA-like peptidoglycan-associated protein
LNRQKLLDNVQAIKGVLEVAAQPADSKTEALMKMMIRRIEAIKVIGERANKSTKDIAIYQLAFISSWAFCPHTIDDALLAFDSQNPEQNPDDIDNYKLSNKQIRLYNFLSNALSAKKTYLATGLNNQTLYSHPGPVYGVMVAWNKHSENVGKMTDAVLIFEKKVNEEYANIPELKEEVDAFNANLVEAKKYKAEKERLLGEIQALVSELKMTVNPETLATPAQVQRMMKEFVIRVGDPEAGQAKARIFVQKINAYNQARINEFAYFAEAGRLFKKVHEEVQNNVNENQEKIKKLIKWIQEYDTKHGDRTYGKLTGELVDYIKANSPRKLGNLNTMFADGFTKCKDLFPNSYREMKIASETQGSEFEVSVTDTYSTPAEQRLICVANYEWERKELVKTDNSARIFSQIAGQSPLAPEEFDFTIESIIVSMGDAETAVRVPENSDHSLNDGFLALLKDISTLQDLIVEYIKKNFEKECTKIETQASAEGENDVVFKFPANVLFAQGEPKATTAKPYAIQDDGKVILNKYVPTLLKVMAGEKELFKRLIVQGHTNSDGESTGYDNQGLSERRAEAVADFCNSDAFTGTQKLDAFKQASGIEVSNEGRGAQELVMVDGAEDKEKSRRVIFKFSLNVDHIAALKKQPQELRALVDKIREFNAHNWWEEQKCDGGSIEEEGPDTSACDGLIEWENERAEDSNKINDFTLPYVGTWNDSYLYSKNRQVNHFAYIPALRPPEAAPRHWKVLSCDKLGAPNTSSDYFERYVVQESPDGKQRYVRVMIGQVNWSTQTSAPSLKLYDFFKNLAEDRSQELHQKHNFRSPLSAYAYHQLENGMKQLAQNPYRYAPATITGGALDGYEVPVHGGRLDEENDDLAHPHWQIIKAGFYNDGKGNTNQNWFVSTGAFYNVGAESSTQVDASKNIVIINEAQQTEQKIADGMRIPDGFRKFFDASQANGQKYMDSDKFVVYWKSVEGGNGLQQRGFKILLNESQKDSVSKEEFRRFTCNPYNHFGIASMGSATTTCKAAGNVEFLEVGSGKIIAGLAVNLDPN